MSSDPCLERFDDRPETTVAEIPVELICRDKRSPSYACFSIDRYATIYEDAVSSGRSRLQRSIVATLATLEPSHYLLFQRLCDGTLNGARSLFLKIRSLGEKFAGIQIFLPLPFSLRRPRFESKGLPFVSIPRFMVISLQRDFFHIRGSRALCFQDILILADARGIYRTRYVTTSIKNNGSLD